ncbi:hypothetical protein [Psychroserpens mesophilus]|uniref:hypothetical protein n=1 Tax=Psychroserpens mesophilus TaxID=325473 RepID=UPI00058F8B11|nr:hypothetical protein [Psychroserpens mesophilus]
MKNLLKAIACAVVISTCYNCSVESAAEPMQEDSIVSQEEIIDFEMLEELCSNQDPQAVLTNNSLLSVDFEVFDQFGLLMTHAYGVPAGGVSPTLTFPDGVTTFIVSTSASEKEVKIDMDNCMIYDVVINENNNLNTDVPTQL